MSKIPEIVLEIFRDYGICKSMEFLQLQYYMWIPVSGGASPTYAGAVTLAELVCSFFAS